MNRQNRKTIAEDTLQIIERGEYVPRPGSRVDIAVAIKAAVSDTRVYTPAELEELVDHSPARVSGATQFVVRNETTLSTARRLVVDARLQNVLCLNFASAKNPGGGFLGGSQAQEESLARSSALYASLEAAPLYYEVNRVCGTAMYTDHMILSPGVPVFRDDMGELLGESYRVAFVTAPAVNAGAVSRNEPERTDQIAPVMGRRIAMLLALAASQGYRHLVLGAWGCGVFRNDPGEIADLFAEHLLGDGNYANSFERVEFAVLDQPTGQIINAFEHAFACKQEGS